MGLTEPAAVRLDAGGGQVLGLELVAEDFPLAVADGPGVVHLEAADGGGGAGVVLVLGGVIAAVDVQGVLRLPGHVHLLLLLLRHCSLALLSHTDTERERERSVRLELVGCYS